MAEGRKRSGRAGGDLTTLPGVADHVLLQLLGEVGTDLGKNWQSEKHFTAWLGLAPGSRQSGKRRGNQKRGRNRAGRLFCVIARSVGRSVDKALGRFYRRLKGRRGGWVANLALARKLAELFWRLMVHGKAALKTPALQTLRAAEEHQELASAFGVRASSAPLFIRRSFGARFRGFNARSPVSANPFPRREGKAQWSTQVASALAGSPANAILV